MAVWGCFSLGRDAFQDITSRSSFFYLLPALYVLENSEMLPFKVGIGLLYRLFSSAVLLQLFSINCLKSFICLSASNSFLTVYDICLLFISITTRLACNPNLLLFSLLSSKYTHGKPPCPCICYAMIFIFLTIHACLCILQFIGLIWKMDLDLGKSFLANPFALQDESEKSHRDFVDVNYFIFSV